MGVVYIVLCLVLFGISYLVYFLRMKEVTNNYDDYDELFARDKLILRTILFFTTVFTISFAVLSYNVDNIEVFILGSLVNLVLNIIGLVLYSEFKTRFYNKRQNFLTDSIYFINYLMTTLSISKSLSIKKHRKYLLLLSKINLNRVNDNLDMKLKIDMFNILLDKIHFEKIFNRYSLIEEIKLLREFEKHIKTVKISKKERKLLKLLANKDSDKAILNEEEKLREMLENIINKYYLLNKNDNLENSLKAVLVDKNVVKKQKINNQLKKLV